MRVIPKEKQSSGASFQIVKWDVLPEGFYQVADGVELSCGGFGTLTVVNNIVTAFTGDEAAYTAWKTANPEPIAQPTTEEKLAILQAKLTAYIQSNQILEDCMVEMAGVVYA